MVVGPKPFCRCVLLSEGRTTGIGIYVCQTNTGEVAIVRRLPSSSGRGAARFACGVYHGIPRPKPTPAPRLGGGKEPPLPVAFNSTEIFTVFSVWHHRLDASWRTYIGAGTPSPPLTLPSPPLTLPSPSLALTLFCAYFYTCIAQKPPSSPPMYLDHPAVTVVGCVVKRRPPLVVPNVHVHHHRAALVEQGSGGRAPRGTLLPAGDVEGRRTVSVLGVGGDLPTWSGQQGPESPQPPRVESRVQRYRADHLPPPHPPTRETNQAQPRTL